MWKNVVLCTISSMAVFVGIGLAQTIPKTEESVLPPRALVGDRDARVEYMLRRLKEAEAGMGPSHPKLAELQRRIAATEKELESLRTLPNPFARMEEDGVEARDIVEQMSEKELRGLAIRLALDMKDLRKRVEALERANPIR